jgi:hypothetical protein
VQRDALYAGLRAVSDGALRAAEAIARRARSPPWGWTALAPETPWRRRGRVGERTLALAQALRQQSAPLVAPGWVPRLVREGSPHSLTAMVAHGGHGGPRPPRQTRGPAPPPRWRPRPALLDAHVIHILRRRRRSARNHRVVCGTNAARAHGLAAWGWQRNPALVERRKLRRRSATSWKGEDGLPQPLALVQGSPNCVLPQARVRQALAEPIATNGTGAAKVWHPSTPALAAGLTDRVCSRKAGRLSRVPLWPQPQTVEDTTPVADRSVEGLRGFRGRPRGVDGVLKTRCE